MLDLKEIGAASQILDHHGLVSATCEDIELVGRINRRLNGGAKRIVSFGKAVMAMVINGLGFTNRRLYLTPQFFESKAVESLLGPGIEAKHLHDDTLGDTLDAIADYGPSKLFTEIAHEIAIEHDLLRGPLHTDTTSFSVTGQYEQTTGLTSDASSQVIKITHGFSKDHRPDLKQVVLSLVVAGDAGMPVSMVPCDGNAVDQKTLPQTIEQIEAFRHEINYQDSSRWVADSSLYTAQNVVKMKDTIWVSRVPETIAAAKEIINQPAHAIAWCVHENGYQTAALRSNYGGIAQRWLLVFSEQAYRREEKVLNKQIEKQARLLEKNLWHLSHTVFQCEADALRTFERLNSKGRFILATNDFNQTAYPDSRILEVYKAQQTVERGFRFLKNPEFIADTLFLKSPRRIAALMMVMTLCLMVYNIAQHRLRQKLLASHHTLPNQLGKPTQQPTLRWIFQMMEGIALITLFSPVQSSFKTISPI